MHDAVTIEEFKRAVADFSKEAPTLNDRELECGFSAVGKMYLGVMPATELNIFTAKTYLEFASRQYFQRRTILDLGHDPLTRLKELVGMK
jgi:hypothetical protein